MFDFADLKELVRYAYHHEAPSDEDESLTDAFRAAGRVERWIDQIERGDRSMADMSAGEIADVQDLAAFCWATSQPPVNEDLAVDNIFPSAERVCGWIGELKRARDCFNDRASSGAEAL
jgi:hypothetical protein